MTKVLPFIGDTELEVLSVFGAFLLVFTHVTTAFCTKEKVVVSSQYAVSPLLHASFHTCKYLHSATKKGLRQEFKEIWDNAKTLPPTIRQIVSATRFVSE